MRWGGGRAAGRWWGRSGPLEACSMRTSGRMARLKKSACFVMDFDVMPACVEVGKGAMMISQPSSTQGCAQLVVSCPRFFA